MGITCFDPIGGYDSIFGCGLIPFIAVCCAIAFVLVGLINILSLRCQRRLRITTSILLFLCLGAQVAIVAAALLLLPAIQQIYPAFHNRGMGSVIFLAFSVIFVGCTYVEIKTYYEYKNL